MKMDDDMDKNTWRAWRNLGKWAEVTVYLPADTEFNEFDLDTSAGEVKLRTSIQSRSLDLNVDAGEVTMSKNMVLEASEDMELSVGAGRMDLKGIKAGSLKVDCDVGELIIKQADADSSELNCGVGSISADYVGSESDYDYTLEAGIGEISIGSESYSGLGRKKNINNKADRQISIECGVGGVFIAFGEE